MHTDLQRKFAALRRKSGAVYALRSNSKSLEGLDVLLMIIKRDQNKNYFVVYYNITLKYFFIHFNDLKSAKNTIYKERTLMDALFFNKERVSQIPVTILLPGFICLSSLFLHTLTVHINMTDQYYSSTL